MNRWSRVRRFTFVSIALLLIVLALCGAMVFGRSFRVIAAAPAPVSGIGCRVLEYSEEPFPWNLIYGGLGRFHYRCNIESGRGVVTSFGYFPGDSGGQVVEAVVQWRSPSEVTITFDKSVNVICRFELGRYANWEMK